MYMFTSPLFPTIQPEPFSSFNSLLYADFIFKNTRASKIIRSTEILPEFEILNIIPDNKLFVGTGLAPDDSLRRTRNELLTGIYREPAENLKYNNALTKIQKVSRINSPVQKWGSSKAFVCNFLSNSVYDAANNVYIVKQPNLIFSGYTHNNQNIKFQILESGLILNTLTSDKFTGEFITTFNIPEGRYNLVVVTYGSGLPTETFYINVKLDTTITDSYMTFEEVLPTSQITKSELQTTKLTGTIEAEASITKVQISDGVSTLNIPLVNITVNPDWSYVINISDLSSLKDGNIIAYITVVDKVGNIAVFNANIELFKFAFSPIVMFI